MTLVGDEVKSVLDTMNCWAIQHTFTKWLAISDLFDGEHASQASLAFAGFVAARPITTFSPSEKQKIVNLLNARNEDNGVPLKWDLIIVKSELESE